MKKIISFLSLSVLAFFYWPTTLNAQCTAGAITKAHSSSIYDALLDPDNDTYITESGAAFTSGTTELAEFEILTNSTTGWIAIIDIDETDSDVTPNCGNSDLIQDNDGGDFAYYNIVDPTPGDPSGGDEYILFRFRLAKSPNGNFGYNFLVDTDAAYGSGVDANSTCGNMGFEREVQFANAGGKKGVSVYDVDGNTAFNSTLCNQCVAIADIQEACAASSGTCATSDPQFITFPLPLSHLGIPSDIAIEDLYIAVATASSGNATSVLGGGNVTDFGALDGGSTGCGCTGLTGCALFDCQTDCVNAAFAVLPVEYSYFVVVKTASNIQLQWATAAEINSSHFVVEHSTDGVHFKPFATLASRGYSSAYTEYHLVHESPVFGVNYYRLKEVDNNGDYHYSPTRAINFGQGRAKRFRILPTIATNEVLLEFEGFEKQSKSQLLIFDLTGRKVFSQKIDSNQSLLLSIDHLESGHYFVRIENGNTVLVQRFLKSSGLE